MLRNKEIRQFVLLFCLMATATVILGFAINQAAGILCLVSAAAFGASFFLFTKARYKRIAWISAQIDLVLHDADRLGLEELEEGELSILHSEITKMTLRIREQNHVLRKEKVHLADSLADIAHQLRTPLTSANLILSLVANDPDENQRKTYVRETEELLLQMDWLITSLLKLSRLDAGVVVFQRETIVVENLIRDALRPLLISMELHSMDLQIHVPEGMVIEGDSRWLSEAMQNILKNSTENAGEKGKIDIICRDNPLFGEIVIHDSGTGIVNDDLPHLFDRFYRGKSVNAAGYGIGLALCKTIITAQGGRITAKNHPQGGALFTIRFPK